MRRDAYLAFFDPCHSGTEDSVEGIEGTRPSGCETENLPMAFSWDHGPTCYTQFDGHPSPPGQYYVLQDDDPNDGQPCDLQHLQNCKNDWEPASHSVWGWDESVWWSVAFKPIVGSPPNPLTGIVAIDLSKKDKDACRLEWLKKTMKSIRDLPGGNFFPILKTFEGFEQVSPCNNTITPILPVLDLSDPTDHPNGFQDMVAALMEPNLVNAGSIDYRETCIISEDVTLDCGIGCGNIYINQFAKQYTFYVKEPDPNDPDLTSLYKIRIEKLSASGFLIEVLSDFSYAKEKTLVLNDLQPGEKIKVTLQQINMGLIGTPPPLGDADGVVEVSRTIEYEDLNPCCSTDPIPVVATRPELCWLRLSISDTEAAGVDPFHWTTVPAATIIPQNAQASEVLVDLSSVNANYLVFCVAGLHESGVIKVGQGTISPLNCVVLKLLYRLRDSPARILQSQ